MSDKFKFNEDKYLEEIYRYIENTHGGYYVGQNNIQSMDLIFSTGHGAGFTIGSVIKYLTRYGKKQGHNRADILKAAHYIILLLHQHDLAHPETKDTT